jgi:hypothetical protein
VFRHVVKADAEFIAKPGERPRVVCFAWKIDDELTQSAWVDELGASPPYPIGDDSLYVIFTQAELTCHLALGWPLPKNVIDLNSELRRVTSGRTLPSGHGLIGFLRWLAILKPAAPRRRTPFASASCEGRPSRGRKSDSSSNIAGPTST